MALAKRSITVVLAAVMTVALAFGACALFSGAEKAYAAVAKPKVTLDFTDKGYVKVSVKKVKAAKKYQYKVATDKKLKKKVLAKKTAKRSIVFKRLEAGNTYYFVVRACDAQGKWGKWSNAKAVGVDAGVEETPPVSEIATDGPGVAGDGNQANEAHEHDYQPGGNYDAYEAERAKNASEAIRYNTLMSQYNQTHSSLNGTFDVTVYSNYQAKSKYYSSQAQKYIELRDAEYYCTICGEKKPAETVDAEVAT